MGKPININLDDFFVRQSPIDNRADQVPLRGIVSFLRSSIRSDEPISDADNTMIDAAIEKAQQQHKACLDRIKMLEVAISAAFHAMNSPRYNNIDDRYQAAYTAITNAHERMSRG